MLIHYTIHVVDVGAASPFSILSDENVQDKIKCVYDGIILLLYVEVNSTETFDRGDTMTWNGFPKGRNHQLCLFIGDRRRADCHNIIHAIRPSRAKSSLID